MFVALGAALRSWKYKMVNLVEVSNVLIALHQNMSKATDRISQCSLGSSPEKSALRDLDDAWKNDFKQSQTGLEIWQMLLEVYHWQKDSNEP